MFSNYVPQVFNVFPRSSQYHFRCIPYAFECNVLIHRSLTCVTCLTMMDSYPSMSSPLIHLGLHEASRSISYLVFIVALLY
jgi:hypothetical protein